VAQDAGWRIGQGSEIIADAASVILFIYGRKALDQARAKARSKLPSPAPGPVPAPA
jgi:hypothetical protein